jgi:hypothetical protein
VFLGGLTWANCRAIPQVKRWFAAHRGNLWTESCHRVGAWLLARNGAAASESTEYIGEVRRPSPNATP